MKASTECVLPDREDRYGSVSPPIYQTATFRQPSATEFGEYDYSRSGNPTRTILERKLARLEHGSFGAAFTSGMAAITAVTRLLESDDEIIASDDLYGGSVRLLEQVLPRQGISVRYADTSNLPAVVMAFSPRTKLVLVETPTNPFLRIADIAELAATAHARRALVAVDNTMLSPCLQNPLDHGADIVIHSATKFLSGHSDIMAGVTVTKDAGIHDRIAFIQNAEGTALAPFDSWLLLRGLKTLALRVERQSSSALKVAEYLAGHSLVRKVYYPGFQDPAGHRIHLRQATGSGAVISFTTGDREISRRLVEGTELCTSAVSFGSVNSTISLPCHMSHASIPLECRDRLAPPSDLVRLSVGIEDVDDIIDDLARALTGAAAVRDLQTASTNR